MSETSESKPTVAEKPSVVSEISESNSTLADKVVETPEKVEVSSDSEKPVIESPKSEKSEAPAKESSEETAKATEVKTEVAEKDDKSTDKAPAEVAEKEDKSTDKALAPAEASTVAKATTETEIAKATDDEVANLPKVAKLKTEAAVAHDKGGVVVPLTESARAEYKSSLEAYMAMRRKNGNHRGTGFRNAGAVPTDGDAEYEYKKVLTPVLPGHYADKASIAALVVTPENIGDLNFDVWYKKLGYIVYVDEQGNFVSPQGDVVSSRDSAAKQIYANDPSDPTRAWTTKVPSVPIGWELIDKQTAYGYNAEKGTVNPNQEKDQDAIGRDTAIVIRKQIQKAIIKYVDQNTGKTLENDQVSGKSGEAIDYSTA
ncbi:mucin-binding protein, partial [Streptococcus oralis]|uniref:mucin-binding protein n=1 Tax=Streptococcus oralis TaxID=1303 RepID=UPI0039C93DFC